MGRKPRIHYPSATYHVYDRGNGGRDIFVDELDYQRFIAELCAVRDRGLSIQSYCLMPTHFHLLAQIEEEPLSSMMHDALGRYSKYFNYRRNTYGHVFQARHGALLCESEAYYRELVRYIHLNPVTAGLVDAPEDWRWSGHRGLLGTPDILLAPARALSMFGDQPEEARRAYLEFLSSPRAGRPCRDSRLASASQTLDSIAIDCARISGVEVTALRGPSRNRAVARARRLFVRRSLDCGLTQAQIARFLGRTQSAVTKMLRVPDISCDNSCQCLAPL